VARRVDRGKLTGFKLACIEDAKAATPHPHHRDIQVAFGNNTDLEQGCVQLAKCNVVKPLASALTKTFEGHAKHRAEQLTRGERPGSWSRQQSASLLTALTTAVMHGGGGGGSFAFTALGSRLLIPTQLQLTVPDVSPFRAEGMWPRLAFFGAAEFEGRDGKALQDHFQALCKNDCADSMPVGLAPDFLKHLSTALLAQSNRARRDWEAEEAARRAEAAASEVHEAEARETQALLSRAQSASALPVRRLAAPMAGVRTAASASGTVVGGSSRGARASSSIGAGSAPATLGSAGAVETAHVDGSGSGGAAAT
jgi:hypothetical protein